jgi:SAM-dependent methyltransferase
MTDQHLHNLDTFEKVETVDAYCVEEGLRSSESIIFEKYIKDGVDILDLGVGAGRTTPSLHAKAKRYVGIDYSAAMIAACRRKFPDYEFKRMDVSNMSSLGNESFDVIVFSFNGLACLHPDEMRLRCLAECSRILRAGGVFLFSLPNPRSLIIRPSRKDSSILQTLLGLFRSVITNFHRVVVRVMRPPFWRGCGYQWGEAHGGLHMFQSVPEQVVVELTRFGFDLLGVCHEDTPKLHSPYISRWYDYAFCKRCPSTAYNPRNIADRISADQ